jgi:hypothetical protein
MVFTDTGLGVHNRANDGFLRRAIRERIELGGNMYSNEVIRDARQADLPGFLMATGERIKKDGHRYRHCVHGSLVFKDNMYYWNSTGEKGNSLDYLTRHMGYSFRDAVRTLSVRAGYRPDSNTGNVMYTAKEMAENNRRVIAYLTKTRHIDLSIVNECIDRKVLYQTGTYNNAAFVMLDENGLVVGNELQGTLSGKRFKGISKGAQYGYGFNITPRQDEIEHLIFFESAVDLLSFWTLASRAGKPLTGCMLISMVGLKLHIVNYIHKLYGGRIVLAVDNDNAAHNFIKQYRTADIPHIVKLPQRKDWNDQLKE